MGITLLNRSFKDWRYEGKNSGIKWRCYGTFENGKKKKREKEEFQKLQDNFHSAAENLRQDDSEENFYKLLSSMSDMAGHILFSPEADTIMKREEEEQKRFYERYKDVFSIVPISDFGKMQHYTEAMLNLVPSIFHGDWQTRFDAYIDFEKFHYGAFDAAYSRLAKRIEQPEYPFHFKPMELSLLEDSLKKCLNKIIALCSENDDFNGMQILFEASRLFELTSLLGNTFTDELKEREKTEERT